MISTSPNQTVKVLGLFGSPRRGGNTDILLEEFLRGCSAAGKDIERIYLSKLRLTGCQSCMGCASTGSCVVQDEMQSVYRALDRSDRIVIASPIYFYGVTSQTKAVIDRTQAFWSRKHLLKQPAVNGDWKHGRKGFFISIGATHGKRLFDGAIFTMRYFFHAMDVHYAGELLYRGIDEKGAIRTHPTALAESYEAGLRFGTA